MAVMRITESWKRTFMNGLKPLMYTMRISRYLDPPVHCPGAWDADHNEYDYTTDLAYHANPYNANKPVCVNGLLGNIENFEIKAVYLDSLTSSQMQMLNIGVLDANEGIFITDGYVDLTNLISIEYPEGTYRSAIFIRDLRIGDVIIAQYAKLRVMQ